MNREWLTRARAKWAKEMTEARKRLDSAPRDERVWPALDIYRLSAQAKALVLIERASR